MKKPLSFSKNLCSCFILLCLLLQKKFIIILRKQSSDLTITIWTHADEPVQNILDQGNLLKEIISSIRDVRNKNNIKPKEKIRLHILGIENSFYKQVSGLLLKQINAESISFTEGTVPKSIAIVVRKEKIFIESTVEQDSSIQKEQLIKDLEYLKGFLNVVEKKLSNERFVKNAKTEVVDLEKKKKADAEDKIRLIEESLASL